MRLWIALHLHPPRSAPLPSSCAPDVQRAALAMLQYTPEVAFAQEDALVLDVSASLFMFNGPLHLSRCVARTLAHMGLQARIGMAPTAQGAWLLAHPRAGVGVPRRCVTLHSLTRRLNRLNLACLPEARARLSWLQGIGCHTLGDLRALPRAGLQRRIGPAIAQAMDTAYGQRPDVHVWFVAPPHFEQHIVLDMRLEDAQHAMPLIEELLAQMSGWLQQRHYATDHLELTFDYERTRHEHEPTVMPLRLGAPIWQSHHVHSILKEKVSRLELAAPIERIGLRTLNTQAMPAQNAWLFPDPGGSAEDRAKLFDLLAARLGPEQIRQPATRADHRPEVASTWEVVPTTPGRSAAARLAPRLPRPFWLLQVPVLLSTMQDRPYYGAPLTLVKGPERIESGWWDGDFAMRDYFVAQAPDFVQYWIYRERDRGELRWFLHGMFA